jgi:hypothetical protein
MQNGQRKEWSGCSFYSTVNDAAAVAVAEDANVHKRGAKELHRYCFNGTIRGLFVVRVTNRTYKVNESSHS